MYVSVRTAAVVLSFAITAFAQVKKPGPDYNSSAPVKGASTQKAGIKAVNDADRVRLSGNVHPKAKYLPSVGRTDRNLPMSHMILVLAQRAGAKAELNQLLIDQHNPASPNYQKWLTPEEFGQRFGVSDQDLSAVTQWLESKGFVVDEIAPGRGWINFSGSVGQVENAFQTRIHDFNDNGVVKRANVVDPTIPRDLSAVVVGVKSLHGFYSKPMHVNYHAVNPNYTTTSGAHYVAPADFAKIYNVNTLYNGGTNGSGQTVAIVGRTDINLGDVQYFRSYFALPANDPVFVHNGTDPGDLGGGEETEALLDVEWSGAVAKNATVKFVISASTSTTDGVDLSAQYIVNNNLAPVMSTSFGQCESSMGTAENNFYNNLWSQAASQGISSFVSSGDSGAAGCDAGSATTGTGRAVSGLSSTPYNIAVGGTQFNDTASPSTYWSSTTNSTDKSSALSYIPEIAWNESGTVSGGSGLWSTGGGASSIYAKPTWQTGTGVPADGKRDVPDVSLTAAGHDGYLIIQGHTSTASGLASVGGTSAASPSFAGLMALLVQSKAGARQGNANTTFYKMIGTSVYHDTTSGNNSVPGVTGYAAGTGYDLATGLGSVDANAMVTNWGTTGGGGGTPQQLIGNPGFENGSANPSPWTTTAGVIDNSTSEPAHSGSWKAWLDGYGTTHTDTVQQTVAIPANITTATLTFWLHIDTAETTTTTAYDKLTVQVKNTSGTVLATLATYSNLNKNSGYAQKSFNLAAYKGQTIVLYFSGSEDSSLQTSFVVDDVNLNVQ